MYNCTIVHPQRFLCEIVSFQAVLVWQNNLYENKKQNFQSIFHCKISKLLNLKLFFYSFHLDSYCLKKRSTVFSSTKII